MSRHVDATRAGLPIELWPEADRQAWQQAFVNRRSPFREDGGGRTLSEHT